MATRKRGHDVFPAYVPLPGSSRELLPKSRPAGPVNLSEIASVTVRTRSAGDFSDLETQVLALYQQPLKTRQYFTRDQLAQQFGAVAADFDAIERHAQKHRLIVSGRNSVLRTIVLTGRMSDLLNAFKANVHVFHHATGTYRGRQGEIFVPKELDGVITAVLGFDTRPKHRAPRHGHLGSAAGPGGDNGVAATDFAKRYNFPTTQGGTALDGTGQCIGVIELGGGFNTSDLQIFFQEVGVPLPNVVAVAVDNTNNDPTPTGADDGEVMLDIEVAGDVAARSQDRRLLRSQSGQRVL